MITVITPTIRPGGLEIVEKALSRQTYEDFEWLIGSPFDPKIEDAIWVEDDFKGGVWTLNRIHNKLIRAAKGDIIVSLQDYTFCEATALKAFDLLLQDKNIVVTGIGDKYAKVYPDLGEVLWEDPRKNPDKPSYRECPFNEIEGNFMGINKSALEEIGGFDEDMDFAGFGMDWYGVLERLAITGKYRFFINEGLKSYSLTHKRIDTWDKFNLINKGYKIFQKAYHINPVLKYLP